MDDKSGTQLGANKTGVNLSSIDVSELGGNGDNGLDGSGTEMATLRAAYIVEAEPLGTVPVPGTVKGIVKTGMEKLMGNSPEVMVDKLGERLAFERTGVRLYESLLTKFQATEAKLNFPGMSTAQLSQFRDQEAQHFKIVVEALEKLGAEPTAQTPGADVVGIESMGLAKVIDDPRTTLSQSLHSLLVAELADNAGWELLIKLAQDMGEDEFVMSFTQALNEEQEHLIHVRAWLEQSVRGQLQ